MPRVAVESELVVRAAMQRGQLATDLFGRVRRADAGRRRYAYRKNNDERTDQRVVRISRRA